MQYKQYNRCTEKVNPFQPNYFHAFNFEIKTKKLSQVNMIYTLGFKMVNYNTDWGYNRAKL